MHIKLISVFVSVLLLFTAAFPCKAIVKISPERFELQADPQKKYINGHFTIKIDGTEPVRYVVYADYFEISEQGTLLTGVKPQKNLSLVDKIRFNPKEVTVMPNIPQKIRFTILNTKGIPEGESRCVLFLEDTKTKVQTLTDKRNNIAASINLKTRIAIPIYLDKGDFKKTAEIKELDVLDSPQKEHLYEINVSSLGNSKVRVEGTAQIIKDKTLLEEFPIGNRPVQAGTVGKIQGIIPVSNLTKGQKYTLRINLKYRDEKSKTRYLKEETEFVF